MIIESGVLTDDEIIKCCEIYSVAKIDYLKTSTGYAERGATVEAISLFRLILYYSSVIIHYYYIIIDYQEVIIENNNTVIINLYYGFTQTVHTQSSSR